VGIISLVGALLLVSPVSLFVEFPVAWRFGHWRGEDGSSEAVARAAIQVGWFLPLVVAFSIVVFLCAPRLRLPVAAARTVLAIVGTILTFDP
jgi:hypothetical protein